MRKATKVEVIYTARRNCFVLRWREEGRTKERKSDAKHRELAIREAVALERELAESKPSSGWEEFKARYEREYCSGHINYNWRAIVKRIEAVADIKQVADVNSSAISKAMASMRSEGRPATTIRGYLRHLMASLSWAKDIGLLSEVPVVRAPKAPRGRKMRSRPITGEEFERLIAAVPAVKKDYQPWVDLLNVLYWGGLRIGEAAILTADWSGDFSLLLEHDPPVFSISGAGQKSGENQLLPVAPELVDYLQSMRIPKRGRLLRGLPRRTDSLVHAVRKIGEASGIVVNAAGKTVTAHDLRRSFGTRWSRRLAPAELKMLMRHRDIGTTMDYYVDIEAGELSKKLQLHAEKNVAPFRGA